ncbi:STAS/SEC14 domain-containing protein [Chelativorans sp. Marseille-P2723]|uniref:STAS/SEC14 domain-containing protein n=1 Tax=Chelativorans sp. Marseille-P2723 TaxID=2709133 RepID=UPI001570F0E1|nr:STAS/SEC14 domain-containing protein [Chelativorans sp. Marseille-P2723]
MLINETPPNVRRIETDRDDAFAFEIKGHIGAADMQNMYGLLEGAYALHERIDVIILIHDYEGVDWAAAWKEPIMLGKAPSLKHIRKYAVVGGPGWIKPMVSLFNPFLSVEMRYFPAQEAEAAWDWIGTRPLPAPA